MTSTGTDQRAYQMFMRKGDPGYSVSPKRTLFGESGTEVRIAPLLDGVRTLTGEKIQWYLAAELRDRIRQTGVRITIIDRLARKQYTVEPRQYEGRLLHQLPAVRTLDLTPGTRAGIIQDLAYVTFCEALAPLEQKLIELLEAQRRAEEEQASREQLRTIQRCQDDAGAVLAAYRLRRLDLGNGGPTIQPSLNE